MIKGAGILLILALSATLGFDAARRLRTNTRQLDRLLQLLNALKGELAFRHTPLAVAFSSLGERFFLPLFERIGEEIAAGSCPRDAFRTVVHQELSEPEVYSALSDLFGSIGSGDLMAELNRIDYAVSRISVSYEETRKKEERYAGMCRSFGILGGLLLALIFV